MTKYFEYARSLLYSLLLLAVVSVVLWNFKALNRAVQNLFVQASSISTIEILGLKLSFNPKTVGLDLQSDLENYERYSPHYFIDHGFISRADYESHISALTLGLSNQEVDRLINVGELKNLCLFQHPNEAMRVRAAADVRLRDKGLVAISDSPETHQRVHEQFAALESQGKLPEIGHPISCYDMVRTDDGYNVRTVLIKGMSKRFEESSDTH